MSAQRAGVPAAEGDSRSASVKDLRRLARRHWAEDRPRCAVETAWAAFDLDSSDGSAKRLIADLLHYFPSELAAERRVAFLGLLTDAQIEPDRLSPAGCHLVLSSHGIANGAEENIALERLTEAIESDELAIALLREAPVYAPETERLFTRVRRWLLLSGEWRRYSGLVSALAVQARLNGGAWPFDEAERACLKDADNTVVAVYLPRPPDTHTVEGQAADPVTRAVAAQYEGWPYPAWTRITLPKPVRLPDQVRKLDPRGAEDLPVDAHMLVAGCGTGRHAAIVASAYPDAAVTAIDISQASLDYGRRQCAALGIHGVEFQNLDLYDVAQLGRQFDAIHCGGVLHHLPDPERGLGALTEVLRPGGVMTIMVYSRLGRLSIAAARTLIRDLAQQPVTDDLLREVRRRLLDLPEHPVAAFIMSCTDMPTLVGAHDLLLHRHEDPFDVPRIERALKRFGLRLLHFDLPSPPAEARYDALFPEDPTHCDFKCWRAFEMREPTTCAGNYSFWCRKG